MRLRAFGDSETEGSPCGPPPGKGERSRYPRDYRSAYHLRSLMTRAEKLELRVTQDRRGPFRTKLFDRCERSEKALLAAMVEMYVQRVSAEGRITSMFHPQLRARPRCGDDRPFYLWLEGADTLSATFARL